MMSSKFVVGQEEEGRGCVISIGSVVVVEEEDVEGDFDTAD